MVINCDNCGVCIGCERCAIGDGIAFEVSVLILPTERSATQECLEWVEVVCIYCIIEEE